MLLINFAHTWNILLDNGVFADFLLMEGYVQGALRKVLLIDSFVEPFETANLGKS